MVFKSLRDMTPDEKLILMRIAAGAVVGVFFYVMNISGIKPFIVPMNFVEAFIIATLLYMLTVPLAQYYLSGKVPPDTLLKRSVIRGLASYYASWLISWIVLYNLKPI